MSSELGAVAMLEALAADRGVCWVHFIRWKADFPCSVCSAREVTVKKGISCDFLLLHAGE